MRLRRGLFFLLLAILLAGCAGGQVKQPEGYGTISQPPKPPFAQTAPKPEGLEPPTAGPVTGTEPAQAGPPVLPSKPANPRTGLLSPAGAPARAAGIPDQQKQKVIINFDKADIAEVTSEIFQNYLNFNYVMDPTLQGRISMYVEGEYTKEELFELINKAYVANFVSIVARDGIYYVQPLQRSAASSLPIADNFLLKEEEGIRPAIVIYRLRYLDAKQALNTARFFLTPGRPLTVEPLTNTLIFVEDTENARTIISVLKSLDMNVLQEVGMEIIPLQALTPDEAVTSMEALMGRLDVFKESAFKSNVAFLPLQHYGGVLVLAQNPEVLSMAKNWLKALDVQGAETGEQIYVYFVQNGLATEIGDIIGQMYGVDTGVTTRRAEERIVRSTQTDTASALRNQQRNQTRTTTPTQRRTTPRTGVGAEPSTMLTGNVIIVPDETNNAIVVRSNAPDWTKIKKSIQSLDIVPREVLIEVLIAEITLTDEFRYGVEWFLKNRGATIGGTKGNFSTSLNNGTAFERDFNLGTGTPAGLSLFWGSVGGDIAALINLLASATKVNVLSNPTLLATDNKEASITVGGKEPIITQTSQNVASESTIVQSIQYEDTGIILTVTPHINAGGLVRLEVDQVIRDAQPNTISGIDSPRFTERAVKTTMLAQNGSTVVIGGIIQTRQSSGKTGVPFLKDAPIISPLFSSRNNSVDRTELIIAITPRVVPVTESDAAAEFMERLRQMRMQIEGAGRRF